MGGSAREHRYEVLRERMLRDGMLEAASPGEHDLPGAGGDMHWYLDLRRYGSVPHAGWGLGFERLIMLVTDMPNIRDVVPVPRHPGNCRF